MPGSPAVMGLAPGRPMTLRLPLSRSLPFFRLQIKVTQLFLNRNSFMYFLSLFGIFLVPLFRKIIPICVRAVLPVREIVWIE